MGLTRIRAEQISDIDYKQATRVISLSNVNLSGGAPKIVDGVSINTNDRVLVAGQTTGSENGLYYVSVAGTGTNGTWTRTTDGNTTGEINAGMIVMVTEGIEWADTSWKLVTNDPIVIGTTSLTFLQNTGNSFSIINVIGSANVLANGVSTQVSFASGNNISITGNNAADIITFDVVQSPSFTGNVTGNYILGNGAFLTGVATGSVSNISNGTSNVTVLGANANISVGVSGTGNVAVFTPTGLSVTSNITGGNILTNGEVSALGNVYGNSFITTGTGGTLSGSGNIIGGNIFTTGYVSAAGNVTGNYFIGNGAFLTGISAGGGNSISNGTSNITVLGTDANISVGISGIGNVAVFTPIGLSVTSNVTGGNILTAGLISATGNVYTGNILNSGSSSSTGNITAGNILTAGFLSAAGNATAGNILTAGLISATGNVYTGNILNSGSSSSTGNIIGGNILTAGLISATSTITSDANISGGNILTAGLISATGNITGNYFIGNGSQLTGINANSIVGSYSNANVANYLPTFSGNLTAGNISASGNTTSGNILTAGLISATGNVYGNAFVTSGTGGGISASGNIIGGNVLISGLISSTGNATAGNLLTAGLISATSTITSAANISGGNILTVGLVWHGQRRCFVCCS